MFTRIFLADGGRRAAGGGCAAGSAPPAARRLLPASSGFTIAELITVVAIIGILSAVALPVARFSLRRQKEIELRHRLRKITDAIDRYHDLMTMTANSPVRPAEMQALKSDGYPKSFEDLVNGVEMSDGKMVRLLRPRDLIDPMTGRDEWVVKATTDDPESAFNTTCKSDESCSADNIFEVHSTSTALSLDGKTRYNEW